MSLTEYCEKYDLEFDHLVALLPEDLAVDRASRFRELANALDTDPEGIVETLKERSRTGKAP
jgi:hypothetical protein